MQRTVSVTLEESPRPPCKTRRRRRTTSPLPATWLVGCVSLLLCLFSTTLARPLPTPSLYSLDDTVSTGPIDDARCNMEDLEQANDSQLYTILEELSRTEFFRQFRVDLERKCPLQSWNTDSEEDEFECEGGKEELDPDAEPLCTVQTDDDNASPFGGASSSSTPFDSNALFSLSKKANFEVSQDQFDTFGWKQHSDHVLLDRADYEASSSSSTTEPHELATAVEEQQKDDCQQGSLLPDSFWMDMCHNENSDDSDNAKEGTLVQLDLNPEHNTGYNGTHIWKAIYEENCGTVDADASRLCYEERVLTRLVSGLHTSTTVSIATHYYPPSKRKNRTDWESNPTFFYQHFEHHPEYIRNLHFSYVVLLRALKKAAPVLREFSLSTGHLVQDETATLLLARLLDSFILQSCQTVFDAFDESLLFQYDTAHDVVLEMDTVTLQQNFKGVFHNISSILDCVQCQQCQLHGKMAVTGYGTALQILLSQHNPRELHLTRNQVVALVQTLRKLSESIKQVRVLTQQYWQEQQEKEKKKALPPPLTTSSTQSSVLEESSSSSSFETTDALTTAQTMDWAVGALAALGRQGQLDFAQEQVLVQWALEERPDLLVLAKHYRHDVQKFGILAANRLKSQGTVSSIPPQSQSQPPDAIVIGSGLAGLSAALHILDRGGRVVLVEKEHLLGGNSNKASSGINACCLESDVDKDATANTLDLFRNDTTRSAGPSAHADLIETLVTRSAQAVTWLKERVGVDLSLVAQLGGHSTKRTHRPNNGMVGAEIIYGVQKAVRAYQASKQVEILLDTRVTQLLTEEQEDGTRAVVGVQYVSANDDEKGGAVQELRAPNVILATGGFAADRSDGSYLHQYRPELVKMPTTAGAYSTGDGISLARSLGAGTTDMDKVQVHPTGWVDPADPNNTSKILAAELMRGIGGLLLNHEGNRFCNELGTRAYVTDQMLAHDEPYRQTRVWNVEAEIPTFSLVLSASAAQDGKKHVDLYSHKGLLTRLEGVAALAEWMGLPKTRVVQTLTAYQEAAAVGKDEFGKTTFRGVPAEDLEKETFYAGTVTPVLHYCMGGVTIDTEGNVLDEEGMPIPGLHAAGEVTGGVHGVNRLAGNSLLECTVFGSLVGDKIPIQSVSGAYESSSTAESMETATESKELRSVPMTELQEHNTPEDCWVAIHGVVYDLTEFAEEHPAGPGSIHDLAGKDGTAAFEAVHNQGLLEDFEDDRIGTLVTTDTESSKPASPPIAAAIASGASRMFS